MNVAHLQFTPALLRSGTACRTQKPSWKKALITRVSTEFDYRLLGFFASYPEGPCCNRCMMHDNDDAYDFQSNGGKLMRGRPMVYRWLEFITRVCRGKRPRRLNVEIERKTVERWTPRTLDVRGVQRHFIRLLKPSGAKSSGSLDSTLPLFNSCSLTFFFGESQEYIAAREHR